MKHLFYTVLFFISFTSLGQEIIIKNYESEEVKDVRNLKIYLPKSYEKDSTSNFPLTIVLDSEKLFNLFVSNAAHAAKNDAAPEQIIIGIKSTETKFADFGFINANGQLTDSATHFYNFIRDEMLPYVESNYKTSPFITIVGEGLAGNFITHFLKEKEPIFNSYICINPTLSPDTVSQITSYYLSRYEMLDNTFYFYMSGAPNNSSKKASRIEQFGSFLEGLKVKNLNCKYDDLKNSPSNLSATSEGIPRALTTVYEKYSAISKEEFNKNIKDLSPPDAILYLETKYLDIEFLFGTSLGIREHDIFAIEGIIIDKENGDYLKEFGEMILKLYPKSQMGNYYLGRYYESGKLYKKALNQYRIGYGKMDPANPKADKFYANVERLLGK